MNQLNKVAAKTDTTDKVVQLDKHKSKGLTLRPKTDIAENKDGAILFVDLPGVSKESLNIDVDQNVLTILGDINLHSQQNLDPTLIEVRSERFERRFTLSEELDSSRIEANLNQGELKLFIPRHEQHKPKKINVKVA